MAEVSSVVFGFSGLPTATQQPIIEIGVLLVTLAVAVWILLRRYRSRRDLTRRLGELRSLAEIGERLAASPLEPDEIAEAAYEEAARVLETDFFQMGVFEGDVYSTLIWVRDGDRLENQSFVLRPDQEGIVGWIRSRGRPLVIRDYESERARLPAEPSYDSQDPPASGIFAPLLVGDDVLGLIAIQSRRPRSFQDHHLRMLTILANAVSSALAMTSLRAQIEFRSLQLVLIKEISQHLTSLQPLQDLFNQVTALIARTLRYPAVRLYEYADGIAYQRASARGEPTTAVSPDPSAAAFAVLAAQSGETLVRPAEGHDAEAGSGPAGHFLAVPLKVEDRVLGVLAVENGEPFPDEHVALAEILAAHLALAVLEARNFSQQQEEAWITTVLVEVARHAARPGDAMDALQAVLQLTTLLAGTTWAALLLPDPVDGQLSMGPASGLRRQTLDELSDVRLEASSLGVRQPYESETALHLKLPPTLSDSLDSENATAVPLTDGSSLLGLLLLEGQELVGRRLSLLVGIGHQISLRLENTRLIDEAAARRSLEREIAMARSIQESFLPGQLPVYAGWEVGATWRMAREVGGDFYDFIPLPPGPDGERWGIAIADVADKGVAAALFMALCRTLLRSVAINRIDPGQTLTRLNDLILADTKTDMFVSVFYAVWEPGASRVSFANAGHNPPLLFLAEAQPQPLREHGMVLGVIQDRTFQTHTLSIPPGGLLLLYTDGATEAMDSSGQFFGTRRLENLVLGMPDWHAQQVVDQIAERVSAFTQEPYLQDDLTAVVLQNLGTPPRSPGLGNR
jgi:serine phosphatase RsbU (regulator of sigma subunit)/GAF domain-containing protein